MNGVLARRLAAVVVAVVAVLVAGLTVVVIPRLLSTEPAYDPNSSETRSFEDRTGIRLIRIALTGGGGMVDVRYQVLDPTKAVNAFGNRHYPILVDESTEGRLGSPWMGHSSPVLRAAAVNYVILVNRDHMLNDGSTVTVVIGDARLEHVPVR